MNSSQPALLRELQTDQRWLVTISRRLLARGDDAEDIAQEASVRALEFRSSGSAGGRSVPAEEARPWLIQTARRLAWNANRREATRAAASLDGPLEEQLAGAQATPVDALARAEFRKVVAALVMDLPEAEREVLVLRFYEDLGTAEIMEATDAPSKGAVRQRLSRGIRRLREQLDNREDARDWRQAAFVISGTVSAKGAVTAAAASGAPALLTVLALCAVAVSGWWALGSGASQAAPAIWTIANGGDGGGANAESDLSFGTAPESERISAAADAPRGASAPASVPGEITITLRDDVTGEALADQPWFVIRTGEHDYGRAWGFSSKQPNPEPIAEGRTDSMGVLRFPTPDEPLVNLVTERSGEHARGSWAIRILGGVAEPGTVLLSEGTTFTGRIVDDVGEPCAGLVLASRTYSDARIKLGITGPDGSFVLPRCADFPRSFVIREDQLVEPTRTLRTEVAIMAPGDFEPGAICSFPGFHIKIAARGRSTVAIGHRVYPRAVIIQGRVLSRDGRPVEGALVSSNAARAILGRGRGVSGWPLSYPWTDPGFTCGDGEAITDEGGEYRLNLSPSMYSDQAIRLVANSSGDGDATLEIPDHAPGRVLGGHDLTLDGLGTVRLLFTTDSLEASGSKSSSESSRLFQAAEGSQGARILWDVSAGGANPAGGTEVTVQVVEGERGGEASIPGALLPDRSQFAGTLRGTVFLPGFAATVLELPPGQGEVVVPLQRLPKAHLKLDVRGDRAVEFDYAKVTITAEPPAPGLKPGEAAERVSSASPMRTVVHNWKNGEVRGLDLPTGSGFYLYVTLFAGTARAPRVLPATGPYLLSSASADAPLTFGATVHRWPERQRLDQTALESGGSAAVNARRPTTIRARIVDQATLEFIDGALVRSVDTKHHHRMVQRILGGEERPIQLEASLDQVTLRFASTGYEPFELGPIALTPGQEVQLGEIALKPLRRVRCSLVRPDGAAVDGVHSLSWRDPMAGWTGVRTSRAGEAEMFVGAALPRSVAVDLGEVPNRNAPAQVVLTKTNEAGECVLVVHRWRPVRLRLQGLGLPWRHGVESVLVEARGVPRGSRHRRAEFRWPKVTGEDVVFDMTLPPGTWVIDPTAPEFISFPQMEVVVPADDSYEAIEVTVRAQLGENVPR